jgi:hypothetical protein
VRIREPGRARVIGMRDGGHAVPFRWTCRPIRAWLRPEVGPAGGATVEGDGLACGSGSRDSRRTLHAGCRDGDSREGQAARDVGSRAAGRDLDGMGTGRRFRSAARQVGKSPRVRMMSVCGADVNRPRPKSQRLHAFAQDVQIRSVAEQSVPSTARDLAYDLELLQRHQRPVHGGYEESGASDECGRRRERPLDEGMLHLQRGRDACPGAAW